jgi:hypothetical protein
MSKFLGFVEGLGYGEGLLLSLILRIPKIHCYSEDVFYFHASTTSSTSAFQIYLLFNLFLLNPSLYFIFKLFSIYSPSILLSLNCRNPVLDV